MSGHDDTLSMSLTSLEKSKEASLNAFEVGIQGYELKSELGRGSFGIVYEAIRLKTGQRVALKLVTHERRLHWEYFARELALLLDLEDHPYTLTVLDARLDGEHPYIVTPLVEGGSLQLCEELPLDKVEVWIRQIAEALHYIHSKGVIHCDLKPSNIYRSGADSIRVGDLGQSRRLIEGEGALGTLGFMAPEQCSVDPEKRLLPSVRWDVYGFGATAYWLLTRRRPRISSDDHEELARLSGVVTRTHYYADCLHKNPLIPIRTLNPRVDADLAAIIEACLRIDPERRTPTMKEVLDDLRRRKKIEPLMCRRPWSASYLLGLGLRKRWIQSLLLVMLILAAAAYALFEAGQDRLFEAHLQSGIHAQESGRLEEAYLHWLKALSYRRGDPATRQRLGFLPILATYPHRDVVRSLALSRDGKWLATASADSTCGIWEVSSGTLLQSMAHQAAVREVAFSPTDTDLLVTASWDGTARMQRVGSSEPWRVLDHASPEGKPGLTNVLFSPDGRWLATADDRGEVRLWEVSSGQSVPLEKAPEAEEGVFQQLAFDSESHLLAALSGFNSARCWELSTGALASPILEHPEEITDLQFQPQKGVLAVGHDRRISLWRVGTWNLEKTLAHPSGIQVLAYNRQGSLLAGGCLDGTVRIWPEAGEFLDFPHSRPVQALEFRPDDRLLAVATGQRSLLLSNIQPNGAVRVWDIERQLPISEALPHHGPVTQVLFHADGQGIVTASGSERGLSSLYRGLARSWTLQLPLSSPGSANWAEPNSPGEVQVKEDEIRFGKQLFRHGNGIRLGAFAFTSDQLYLATGGEDWTVRLWLAATGQSLLRPLAHEGSLRCLGFSSDGAWLASASSYWNESEGSQLRLWDVQSGNPISPVLFCPERVKRLRFGASKQHLELETDRGMSVFRLAPLQGDFASVYQQVTGRLRCLLDARGGLQLRP